MTELFIRAYLRNLPQDQRYDGDAALGDVEPGAVDVAIKRYWTKAGLGGSLLVISNRPLGEKRKTFEMRKK